MMALACLVGDTDLKNIEYIQNDEEEEAGVFIFVHEGNSPPLGELPK